MGENDEVEEVTEYVALSRSMSLAATQNDPTETTANGSLLPLDLFFTPLGPNVICRPSGIW